METIISGVASFFLFQITTHPKSKINKKIPRVKISRFSFAPRFTFEAKNRVFHLHHWMLFTPILVFTQTRGTGILQSDLLHGFLLGTIVQGLLYRDRFKVVSRYEEFEKRVSQSSLHLPLVRRIINYVS